MEKNKFDGYIKDLKKLTYRENELKGTLLEVFNSKEIAKLDRINNYNGSWDCRGCWVSLIYSVDKDFLDDDVNNSSFEKLAKKKSNRIDTIWLKSTDIDFSELRLARYFIDKDEMDYNKTDSLYEESIDEFCKELGKRYIVERGFTYDSKKGLSKSDLIFDEKNQEGNFLERIVIKKYINPLQLYLANDNKFNNISNQRAFVYL